LGGEAVAAALAAVKEAAAGETATPVDGWWPSEPLRPMAGVGIASSRRDSWAAGRLEGDGVTEMPGGPATPGIEDIAVMETCGYEA
jgi:hypothetical protein